MREKAPWKALWILETGEGVMDITWHSIDAMEEEVHSFYVRPIEKNTIVSSRNKVREQECYLAQH